jgi:hypothetical protein
MTRAGSAIPPRRPTGILRTQHAANRDGGHRDPRKVDGKHASFAGDVPTIDPAVMSFDGPSAERETEAQAGSIGSALLERAEQFVNIPAWDSATLVLHLDEHAFGAGADPQRDGRVRALNLKAFCSTFVSTAARMCRSASMDTPSSTGNTVSVTPRLRASSVAADANSAMNSETRNCSRF